MKKLFILVALSINGIGLYGQVFVNEVCAANGDLKFDPKYFNFSPWVELYNAGSSSVNVGGFFLSDKLTDITKWQIPANTMIPAKGYLLIWCDNMNDGIHTNFSLDSDGEDVILSSPAALMVDKVTYVDQLTNISFGRTTDGGGTLANLVTPTPGAANNPAKGSDALEKPNFSLTPGRYPGALSLSLTHSQVGVTIRFTTDGSEPTSASSIYSSPIAIPSTRTIKAKAFLSNFLPSKTETSSYFINEHNFTLPVVSISTTPTYLWDNIIGIYTDGTNGIPGNCRSEPLNWNQDWDRHAFIEYFSPEGQRIFDQSIDIRIGGACSRGQPQKSFVVKARDKYGKKTIN